MRANLENNLGRALRLNSTSYGTVRLILNGTFIVDDEGPTLHFLDPNGVTRTVFLPPKMVAGGQQYWIANIGTAGDLIIVDDLGGPVATAHPGTFAVCSSSPLEWEVLAGTAAATTNDAAIEFVLEGGGATIPTGLLIWEEIPWNATITGVKLTGDAAGSIVADIRSVSFAGFPGGAGNTICGGNKPTLVAAQTFQDNTLVGWTTEITKGNFLLVNVDSVSGLQRVTLSLRVTKG